MNQTQNCDIMVGRGGVAAIFSMPRINSKLKLFAQANSERRYYFLGYHTYSNMADIIVFGQETLGVECSIKVMGLRSTRGYSPGNDTPLLERKRKKATKIITCSDNNALTSPPS